MFVLDYLDAIFLETQCNVFFPALFRERWSNRDSWACGSFWA